MAGNAMSGNCRTQSCPYFSRLQAISATVGLPASVSTLMDGDTLPALSAVVVVVVVVVVILTYYYYLLLAMSCRGQSSNRVD